VRDSTSNPLSSLYFLGVPVSPAFQRLTMAVAVFDALSSSNDKGNTFQEYLITQQTILNND
jgi:hypothetical protein